MSRTKNCVSCVSCVSCDKISVSGEKRSEAWRFAENAHRHQELVVVREAQSFARKGTPQLVALGDANLMRIRKQMSELREGLDKTSALTPIGRALCEGI